MAPFPDLLGATLKALGTLDPGWIGAIGAILAAGIGAWLTIRGNIRTRAWERVYMDKRGQISEFLDLVDQFAQGVCIIGEVRGLREVDGAGQMATIHHWARALWGDDPRNSPDPGARALMQSLPSDIQAVVANGPEARRALDGVRTLFINLMLDRLTPINLRMGTLRTRMLLTTRYPDAAEQAHKLVATTIHELIGDGQGIDAFDFDGFPTRWAEGTAPIKLKFRKDMVSSAKGLRAALLLSRRWRAKRLARRALRRLGFHA